MKWTILLFFMFLRPLAQAEFIEGDASGSENHDTVIVQEYVASINQEEPVFSSRKPERDIAALREDASAQPMEWQGQLAVVKEIPYSYPWVSHHTMRLRVLNEIEQEEEKKSSK